jgi:hypothetical protein
MSSSLTPRTDVVLARAKKHCADRMLSNIEQMNDRFAPEAVTRKSVVMT